MALNIQTFKTRAVSALLFTLVMLAGLLWNHWAFLLLFTVIHFGCWMEFGKMLEKILPEYKNISSFHRFIIPLIGFASMLYATNDRFVMGAVNIHALGWWLGLGLILMLPLGELLFARQTPVKCYIVSLLGLLYISMSWSMLMELREMSVGGNTVWSGSFDMGKWIVCVLVFSIWINDTMAYIVGSLIGKTPFSPISPKKTWEGTIGGAVVAIVVVGFGTFYLMPFSFSRQENPVLSYHYFLIPAIAAVFGTLGDLLESKLKRKAGIKDSGSILPGHGGFLDRFDSLLVATPFVWLLILWYGF